MHFTNIIISGFVASVYGAPIINDELGPRDDDDCRHCVGAAPMVQVAPDLAPASEVAPAVWPHVELDDRDVDDDLENLEAWPSVELENRDVEDLEEGVGEMEDAEELEDRDLGAVEAADKHHKHIRCSAPAVWNASIRRCVAPAAPVTVAACVAPMIYDAMTGQFVRSAGPAPVAQCVAPMVYPMTRTCVMPATAPAPVPAPVTPCVAPMVYNAATRNCVTCAVLGSATALAKPTCTLGELAYCAKTSTNYVAYDAANPLCHADGVNMVFCAAPARVMAMLQASTFANENMTAGNSVL